jgi:hypothetical protein
MLKLVTAAERLTETARKASIDPEAYEARRRWGGKLSQADWLIGEVARQDCGYLVTTGKQLSSMLDRPADRWPRAKKMLDVAERSWKKARPPASFAHLGRQVVRDAKTVSLKDLRICATYARRGMWDGEEPGVGLTIITHTQHQPCIDRSNDGSGSARRQARSCPQSTAGCHW